jgi:hypothetical protein
MSILEALPVFARALLLLGCREQQTRQNSPYIKNLPRLVDIHAAMPFEEVVRYISQELSDSIINAAKAQHEGPEPVNGRQDSPQPDVSKRMVPMTSVDRESGNRFVETKCSKWAKKYGCACESRSC